jgi:hypothetical protein
MTVHPGPRSSSCAAALDYEIAQAKASSLGRLGSVLEAALAVLSEHDRSKDPERRIARSRLVQDAADALWCYMVQRESIGLRDPRPVIREYRVPAEVQNRVGCFGGDTGRPVEPPAPRGARILPRRQC